MLYIRGPLAQAAVRFKHDKATDSIIATFLNDGSTVSISRVSDQTFLAGLKAFDNKIVALVGAPTIVSDISELV